MKISGIICEYNPFHNGHIYHIEETRRQFGATHIVAVMSGNFTQRGDIAVIDKYKRARAALENGVDLVIELPVAFATANAEQFTYGSVFLLNALGCVDTLSFGSECGSIQALEEAAGAVAYASQTGTFFGAMRNGSTYPAALQKAIEEYYTDDVIETITHPNNTLAVEYIKAINEVGALMKPVTVKRFGAEHDSDESDSDTVISASRLRKMIVSGEDVSGLLPETDFSETAELERLEAAILAKLRTMSTAELGKVPNVTAGLDTRIYKAVRAAVSLPELLVLAKTKRYTMARIRRAVISAFLGISKNDLKNPPAYVRILGMNERGKEILSTCSCALPINTSLADLAKAGDTAKKQAELEARCDDLYVLAFKKARPCGTDFTVKPVIIK